MYDTRRDRSPRWMAHSWCRHSPHRNWRHRWGRRWADLLWTARWAEGHKWGGECACEMCPVSQMWCRAQRQRLQPIQTGDPLEMSTKKINTMVCMRVNTWTKYTCTCTCDWMNDVIMNALYNTIFYQLCSGNILHCLLATCRSAQRHSERIQHSIYIAQETE